FVFPRLPGFSSEVRRSTVLVMSDNDEIVGGVSAPGVRVLVDTLWHLHLVEGWRTEPFSEELREVVPVVPKAARRSGSAKRTESPYGDLDFRLFLAWDRQRRNRKRDTSQQTS